MTTPSIAGTARQIPRVAFQARLELWMDRWQRGRGRLSAASSVLDRRDSDTSYRSSMRTCEEVFSVYTLAEEMHVDVNFKIQGTGECVKALVQGANELWGGHDEDGSRFRQSSRREEKLNVGHDGFGFLTLSDVNLQPVLGLGPVRHSTR